MVCLSLFVLQQLLHINTKSFKAGSLLPLIIDSYIGYIRRNPILESFVSRYQQISLLFNDVGNTSHAEIGTNQNHKV
ncbi:hypothetical protein BH18THE2_BH18THE2_25350 [soil metagenome]